MALADLAQPGVLSNPTAFAEYLTFVVRPGDVTPATVAAALSMLDNATTSIRQKDPSGTVSSTIGFSSRGWSLLFPDEPMPQGLAPFPELSEGGRHFPSTPGDVFVMVKAGRIDYAMQVAKYVIKGFRALADCTQDERGFRYLDDRDVIDFVDGTENPNGHERATTVLVPEGQPYAGGSHLVIQRYLDREAAWDAQSTEEQEGVIGRTKFDDIELPDAAKKPYAHNVKSKVHVDGLEVKMYRQNRAIGTALEHGTMFVGFAAAVSTLLTSLHQMITADEQGNYDHLLDFVEATTGTAYFCPPQGFLDALTGN